MPLDDVRQHLKIDLGCLASVEYQQRFCVEGTVSAYETPSDIFESAVDTVETVLSSKFCRSHLGSSEIEAMRAFLNVVHNSIQAIPLNTAGVANEQLIHRDPAWNQVRVAAQQCLEALSITVTFDELARA